MAEMLGSLSFLSIEIVSRFELLAGFAVEKKKNKKNSSSSSIIYMLSYFVCLVMLDY